MSERASSRRGERRRGRLLEERCIIQNLGREKKKRGWWIDRVRSTNSGRGGGGGGSSAPFFEGGIRPIIRIVTFSCC